ncbi:MAG TPA: HAMP domain-containing sensor histidine kinase [Tepidisphaeraceae bacterium]
MRMGLEGKLILSFMAVICMALTVMCFVFADQTDQRLSDLMGEQARQVATALSLVTERAARSGDWAELNRRGQELIKSRNILFVGFLDGNARPRALSSRDPDFILANLTLNPLAVMRAQSRQSETFGDYLEVVAPIFTTPVPSSDIPEERAQRLLGYVAVGVSQASERAQMNQVQYMVIGLACVMTMASLPVAYLLVHRVFLPIRKLVTVTKQISAGDLDARVEAYRPDIIGDLARSFDEMVNWVKKQREDLADANAQLADANRDLEQRIEQRTAQLATANTRLESEIADKEAFLRAVSHDLNAPLRNIAGMASMLLLKHRQELDEEITHRLERIKSNVDSEMELIAELLELSRIKTRRQKMEPVDVDQTVAELTDMFESDLRSKSIALFVDTPLPTLVAERSRTRQVFQNLIDNAIKYMGNGARREIHVGCELRPTEAEFYVQDTGVGIDPEDVEKVFLVFRRGKNSLAQNIAGKGVGLASVKSIVETYNGKIWVSSTAGEGSTFRFTINGRFVMELDGAVTLAGVEAEGDGGPETSPEGVKTEKESPR